MKNKKNKAARTALGKPTIQTTSTRKRK